MCCDIQLAEGKKKGKEDGRIQVQFQSPPFQDEYAIVTPPWEIPHFDPSPPLKRQSTEERAGERSSAATSAGQKKTRGAGCTYVYTQLVNLILFVWFWFVGLIPGSKRSEEWEKSCKAVSISNKS